VLYDKEGDYHFDTISAFIKSLRGSDPDATMYWMAKMVYAGEAPRFIFRRMLIFAGEDVGLADPNAITVVTSCAQAFEQVGMPEGRFHLATAALYLATCKKSNTTFAFFDALATVEKEADSGVPNHLKDGNRDKEGFGHGEGYLYPHAYQDHWVAQQYLPTSLQGKVFYQPSDQGYEAQIRVDVSRRREEQLAAMLSVTDEHLEVLSFSPDDPAKDRWLQRTISNAGERLGVIRDRVLDAAKLQRHHLVLDLKAATGLITWEALRRVPEGGVYALTRNERDAEAIQQQATKLKEMERPIVTVGDFAEPGGLDAWGIGKTIQSSNPTFAQSLRFDALVGYNALIDQADKAKAVQALPALLNQRGVISLAERIPRHTQRLYRLVDLSALSDALQQRIRTAEEAIYAEPNDPLVNWDEADLIKAVESAGLQVDFSVEDEASDMQITANVIERWFAPSTTGKPSYGQRLAALLSGEEIKQLRSLFERQLLNKTVKWGGKIAFLLCKVA
jgi:putative ATPase